MVNGVASKNTMMTDSDSDMDSEISGYSAKSRSSRSGTPNSMTSTSECQNLKEVMKRIIDAEKDMHKYETYLKNPKPGGPTKGYKQLFHTKRHERENLVRELQNLPPCTDPDCPDNFNAPADSVSSGKNSQSEKIKVNIKKKQDAEPSLNSENIAENNNENENIAPKPKPPRVKYIRTTAFLTNSNSCTASRRNQSSPDRFPLVPAPFTPPLIYNDCNTKPSLMSDIAWRSLPRLQFPVKSKCVQRQGKATLESLQEEKVSEDKMKLSVRARSRNRVQRQGRATRQRPKWERYPKTELSYVYTKTSAYLANMVSKVRSRQRYSTCSPSSLFKRPGHGPLP
ncbi:hypothetical protein TNCV_364911 [Trichonephila clavipes]|nr:hypothetical protein TNCV_364911 [Trichonephila clavipes]